MVQFYLGLLTSGLIFMTVLFVLTIFRKRKSDAHLKQLEEKRQELIKVIQDSEQMLEELNKFSDYIVTQVDSKNLELNNTLRQADERISTLKTDINQVLEAISEVSLQRNEETARAAENGKGADAGAIDMASKRDLEIFQEDNAVNGNFINLDSNETEFSHIYNPYQKTKEKVIYFNNKHKDVIQLTEKGLSDSEIARTLNIGKGEIQLIKDMDRQRNARKSIL